jgi:hypothetical protein
METRRPQCCRRLALVLVALALSSTAVFAQGRSGTTLRDASKTAVGFNERTLTYDWTLSKSVPACVQIGTSQQGTFQICLTATRSLTTDSGAVYGVRGQICVKNDGAEPTENLTITDELFYKNPPSVTAFTTLTTISVDTSAKPVLAPGESYCYPYEITFTPVSGTNVTYKNTAHIRITNHSGHLDTPFGPDPSSGDITLPTTTTLIEIDKTASVDDDETCPSGFTCTPVNTGDGTGPWTFSNSGTVCFNKRVEIANLNVACTSSSPAVTDTATLTESDTGQTRSSGQKSVCIDLLTGVCGSAGCTYTQGYWKTHSKYGPAKRDSNWNCVGEDTAFFNSGSTWYQVLNSTPAGGNAYYILAKQYIAAKLNQCKGADTSVISSDLTTAQNLLSTYTPTSTLSAAVRQQFLNTATKLDNYNKGIIGPGHCGDE